MNTAANDPAGQPAAEDNRSPGPSELTLGMPVLPPQEPNLAQIRASGQRPPAVSLQPMDLGTLYAMTVAERADWYRQQIGAWLGPIHDSARRHQLPPMLIATIILNELAKIDLKDQIQNALRINGSIGIAQIQVATAIEHSLVHQEGDEAYIADMAEVRYNAQLMDPGIPNSGPIRPREQIASDVRWELTFDRLRNPQYAIEAVALELRHLLAKMAAKPFNPWQNQFGFSLSTLDELTDWDDLYGYVAGGTPQERGCKLAQLLAAAYNSPEIIDAIKIESITPNSPEFRYPNAISHGDAASMLMQELFSLEPVHRALRLYSGWVGRVMLSGPIARYSRFTVSPMEYLDTNQGRPMVIRPGTVQLTVTTRALSKSALLENYLENFYDGFDDDISDDMVPPLAPVTVRVFSQRRCRLQSVASGSTHDDVDAVLTEVAEGGAVDWSEYASLPAGLLQTEGGGGATLTFDAESLLKAIRQWNATHPDELMDETVDFRIAWYLNADEIFSEHTQMNIECVDVTIELRP